MTGDRGPESGEALALRAENVTVRIRWLGVALGCAYVNLGTHQGDRALLNAILGLGALFTVFDTLFSLRGRVLLSDYPLIVSFMEAIFIGLLCIHDSGLSSPFRYYFLLSLICCAIRHSGRVTYITCALDCASYLALYLLLPEPNGELMAVVWMVVVLIWVAWAGSAMAGLLKRPANGSAS